MFLLSASLREHCRQGTFPAEDRVYPGDNPKAFILSIHRQSLDYSHIFYIEKRDIENL